MRFRHSAPGLLFLAVLALGSVAPAHAALIVVDTLDDTDLADGECSLREAIRAANQDAAYRGCSPGADDDRIEFAVAGRIELADDLPAVRDDLTILGPEAGGLIVDGGDLHRIFLVEGPIEGLRLHLRRLTVRDGLNPGMGGCAAAARGNHLVLTDVRVLDCTSLDSGGGVAGDGARSLRLVRTLVSTCSSDSGGGGVAHFGEGLEPLARGGLTSTFSMEDSTVVGNLATGGETAGGGVALVLVDGALLRSTLSGNRTDNAGGGLVQIFGDVVLVDSTLTENVADADDDDEEHAGGGYFLAGDAKLPATLTLRNTIVAGNHDGPSDGDARRDEFSTTISLGFNFVGVNVGAVADFPAGEPNVNGDHVGTFADPLDAGLGGLDDNGGATPTHLPGAASRVVDLGNCPAAGADQRGFGDPGTGRRIVDVPNVPDQHDGCDVGAVERGAESLGTVLFDDGFESGDVGEWSSVVP